MEAQITKHSQSIQAKIPDIEKALECVEFLEKKYKDKCKKVNVDYMVSANLYSKAEVNVSDKVCLWLGAEILCEYTFNEASELLNKNKENATTTLKTNVR